MSVREKIRKILRDCYIDGEISENGAINSIMALIENDRNPIRELADHWIIKQKQSVELLEKDLERLRSNQEKRYG